MYNELLEEYGSPLYIYDEQEIINNLNQLNSLKVNNNVKFNYAVKANSNREILKLVKQHGFKVDSTGIAEIEVNMDAGFNKEEIYCVGNNFNKQELQDIVNQDVLISLDSIDQIKLLGEIAPGYDKIMIRINPPFGAGATDAVTTGGKKTKFGIDYTKLSDAIEVIKKYNLNLIGVNQHIGSAYLEHESLIDGVKFLLDFVLENKSLHNLQILDFGGGFGVNYERKHNDLKMDFDILREQLKIIFDDFLNKYPNKDISLEFEPGRFVVATAGKLIGTVTSIKERDNKNIIGTDLGFNNMIRPVLYDSYHEVETESDNTEILKNCEVVGNVCESGDYIAKNRTLLKPILGDAVIVYDTGAYGYSLASNYNSRPRPVEIMKKVDGTIKIIRRRETVQDLLNLY